MNIAEYHEDSFYNYFAVFSFCRPVGSICVYHRSLGYPISDFFHPGSIEYGLQFMKWVSKK